MTNEQEARILSAIANLGGGQSQDESVSEDEPEADDEEES